MKWEESDIVLCIVDRIERANVFVKIENTEEEGSIAMGEIVPGRIKNIREFVVPKKKIVCKVLRISGDRIELSLRRVTLKEKEERLNQEKEERSYKSVIKAVAKEKAEEIVKNIEKERNIYDFIKHSIENKKELEKVAGKEIASKIIEIIEKQKQTSSLIKKEFALRSNSPEGIKIIKEILDIKKGEINYISAGRYSIKIIDKDKKSASRKIQEILEEIENKSKEKEVEFSIKEK